MQATLNRHLAPAIDEIAAIQDLGFHDLPAAFLGAEIGLGHEDLADRDAAGAQHRAATLDGRREETLDGRREEILRDLDMDAGAVTRFPIRIDRAAMPHGLERIDTGLHDVAPALAVQRRDHADAAGIMLLRRVIGIGERGRVARPGVEEFGGGLLRLGHLTLLIYDLPLPERDGLGVGSSGRRSPTPIATSTGPTPRPSLPGRGALRTH